MLNWISLASRWYALTHTSSRGGNDCAPKLSNTALHGRLPMDLQKRNAASQASEFFEI